MNNTTQNQMAERAAEIEARLAEIEAERAPLDAEADELREEAAQHGDAARARDWAIEARLTGRRPAGAHSDGSTEATYRQRTHHVNEARAAERDLADVLTELGALSGETAALGNELAQLKRDMVTPADLTAKLAQLEGRARELEQARPALAKVLEIATKRRAAADAHIGEEPAAAAALKAARAAAYLQADDAAARAAVDDAELAASTARDRAAGARAASGQLIAQEEDASQALAEHDALIEGVRRHAQRVQAQCETLTARLAVADAVQSVGVALGRLLVADEEAGMRLAQSLADDGLRILDADGRPATPRWLLAGVNLPRPARRAALARELAALAEV